MLSYLAFHTADGEIKGLKSFPKDERPPVAPVFLSFRFMVGLGFFFILASLAAVIISRRGTLEANPLFLKIMLYSIPLPYIANQLGWIVAEVGRQPWIVYGVLKTSDAVSKSISTVQVVGSLVGFTLIYGVLGFIDVFLLMKFARKGPDNDLSAIIKPAVREV
jgi:cytochrome d ubiquinol oxidase subunit I